MPMAQMANRQILPVPPSSLTPNTLVYPAYERWLREEAGIIAPKVHVVGFAGDRGAGAGGLGSLPANISSSSRISRVHGDGGDVDDNGGNGGDGGGGDDNGDDNGGGHAKTSVAASAATKIRQHRGLYSTERIEPGEQFIFIPSRCMIGEDLLRNRGTRLLQHKGDGPAGHSDPYPTSDDEHSTRASGDPDDGGGGGDGNDKSNSNSGEGGVSPSQTRTEMQDELMMLIEEIRRMSAKRKRTGGDHEWKSDDSVALFLVGCKKIQRLVPFQAATATSSAPSPLPDTCNVGCSNNSNSAEEDSDDSVEEASLRPPPCFVPHISMLPHSFPTNRLYYSPEELERMGGEIRTDGKRVTRKDMLKQIDYDHLELVDLLREYYQERGGIEAAKHVYKYCDVPGKGPVGAWFSCFVLDPDSDLTIDSYKWALSNIYSRSTDFPRDGSNAHVRRVIAPLLDVMNHFHASQVRPEMDREGNIRLYNGSDEAIEPGQEILLNYGDFPNEKLLLVYGFFFFFSDY